MNSNSTPYGIAGYVAGQEQKLEGAMAKRAVAFINPMALGTVGAGTLLAALLAPGNLIQRTGPTVAFTDTTDTAANIIAAYPEIDLGVTWEVAYANEVAFAATFAAGAGVTLTGLATNAGSGASNRLFVTKTSATTVSIQVA